jgi:hypothetical protein
VSRQWYNKFDKVVKKFGFVENQVDNCIYIKIKRNMFIILVLYVNDIILASGDKNLLYETKEFLSSNVDVKNLGDVLCIGHRNSLRQNKRSVWPISKSLY